MIDTDDDVFVISAQARKDLMIIETTLRMPGFRWKLMDIKRSALADTIDQILSNGKWISRDQYE